MAIETLKTKIKLRRDTEANYTAVQDTLIPLAGEVCLVVTSLGLRAKIGDGGTAWRSLPYTDQDNQIVVYGYLLNNDFYKDSTYQLKYDRCTTHLYIDRNTNGRRLYFYNGSSYEYVTPEASDTIPGVMKLYTTSGQNEDGTMTQKAVTDGVNNIKFALDSTEDECLILNSAW